MGSESNALDIAQENITEIEISVEPKYHGHFFANRRALLHKITMESGAVEISFPRANIDNDSVIIKGTLESINSANQRIRESIQNVESLVTIHCEIPRRHRYRILGAKGCNVQSISAEFDVKIKFPDRYPQETWRSDKYAEDKETETKETVPDYDIVRITGRRDDAEAAKQALLSLVPITIEVDVPNYLHRSLIGHGGQDVRELREKYDVGIVLSRADQQLDYITITGISSRVNEAKKAILEKCKILEIQRKEKASSISFELKVEVDSEYHPEIIGHSEGDTIRNIISDNDVAINFPCIGDSEDNVITISGSEENVYNARDHIMKIINGLEQRDSMVFGLQLVPETENKHVEISPCGSPALSINSEITDSEDTDVEQKSQDLSNVDKEFNEMEDDIEIEGETEEVGTKIPKNISNDTTSVIIENYYTDAMNNSRENVSEFYNDVILKQEKKIMELKDILNDQVSTNKALKVERTQLIVEITSEQEQWERIIHEKEEKCETEITKLSETIKDMREKFNSEREEKLKIEAENNESSRRFEELNIKYRALRGTSTRYEKEIEFLNSRIKELEEKEANPRTELNGFECTRSAVSLNDNFKL